jgi:hypothetical protein
MTFMWLIILQYNPRQWETFILMVSVRGYDDTHITNFSTNNTNIYIYNDPTISF